CAINLSVNTPTACTTSSPLSGTNPSGFSTREPGFTTSTAQAFSVFYNGTWNSNVAGTDCYQGRSAISRVNIGGQNYFKQTAAGIRGLMKNIFYTTDYSPVNKIGDQMNFRIGGVTYNCTLISNTNLWVLEV